MKIKFLIIASIIFFYGCSSSEKADKNKIIGSWELLKVISYNKDNSQIDQVTKSKLGAEMLSNGLTLHFFPDSSFAEIEGKNIKFGSWSYLNEKAIKYGNHKLIIETFGLDKSDKTLLTSIRNVDTNIESDVKFIEEFGKIKDYKKHAFYKENNIWREKPQKKETNEGIIARLSNYILHNAYILKAAHERNDGSVSFTNSKGIIKVYQGGIGIVKESRINKKWMDCFYDEADAMKAFNLFKSYLNKQGVYKVKSTGDWVKDDYGVLMELYAKIKNTKAKDTKRFKK